MESKGYNMVVCLNDRRRKYKQNPHFVIWQQNNHPGSRWIDRTCFICSGRYLRFFCFVCFGSITTVYLKWDKFGVMSDRGSSESCVTRFTALIGCRSTTAGCPGSQKFWSSCQTKQFWSTTNQDALLHSLFFFCALYNVIWKRCHQAAIFSPVIHAYSSSKWPPSSKTIFVSKCPKGNLLACF